MAGKVTCIPATKNRFTALPVTSVSKRRVAAYARVSTDSEEQLTSYEAQVDYYTKLHPAEPRLGVRGSIHGRRHQRRRTPSHRDGFNRDDSRMRWPERST